MITRLLTPKGLLTRQVRFGRIRDYLRETKLAKKWKEAPENIRRTRKMMISSFLCLFWTAYQLPFYACLPPKPEMPTHLADEDGNYPPEVAKSFTTEQREEYLNEYPIVPNRYRVWVAESRMKQGWAVKMYYCKKWWEELKAPEYELFLPDKSENDPKITISFDLSLLLESEWNLMEGFKFKLRPGAKYFVRCLSESNCELVLYTTFEYYATVLPIAEILYKKFDGHLDLREETVRYKADKGVNYKLFKNSCRFQNGEYVKVLTQMNRSLQNILHIDQSRIGVDSESDGNCIYLEDYENVAEKEKLVAITNKVIDIINIEPDDVRDVLKCLPTF